MCVFIRRPANKYHVNKDTWTVKMSSKLLSSSFYSAPTDSFKVGEFERRLGKFLKFKFKQINDLESNGVSFSTKKCALYFKKFSFVFVS